MNLNEMSILSSFPRDQNANAQTIFICYSFKQCESHPFPPQWGTYNQSQLICYCFFFKQVALWPVLSMDYFICFSQIHDLDTVTLAILQMSKLRLGEVGYLFQGHIAAEWKSQSNFGTQSLNHHLCFLQPV